MKKRRSDERDVSQRTRYGPALVRLLLYNFRPRISGRCAGGRLRQATS